MLFARFALHVSVQPGFLESHKIALTRKTTAILLARSVVSAITPSSSFDLWTLVRSSSFGPLDTKFHDTKRPSLFLYPIVNHLNTVMSGFGNYEFPQGQAGAEDNNANNPSQVPPQGQQPTMASQSDNQPAPFQGGATDPGSAGGPQPVGDAKTTLWSVELSSFKTPSTIQSEFRVAPHWGRGTNLRAES